MKPIKICFEEWLYYGCFIQKFKHPKLFGKYVVFKNNKLQTHVGICKTFIEAKNLCQNNKCFDNVLKF